MTAGLQLGVIGSLALSVASSVAIVICNKALISTLGFPFGQYRSLHVCKIQQNLTTNQRPCMNKFKYLQFMLNSVVFECSYNINKLASHGDLLHPPCGTTLTLF